MIRIGGRHEQDVRDRIDWLLASGLEVQPVWLSIARTAASIRAGHYHRERAPISRADAVCLATAVALGADLATSDRGLAAVAAALGVEVVALPDSSGRQA